MLNVSEYIEINTQIRFGKPIVKGTRISVKDVLSWLANGMNSEEIISDFPELTKDKINACLFFAANQSEFYGIAS
ncbi:MAG: DUF433 domain-containing protein [Bacteroidetes bacterium]|nr:DUF433 domain-containing protein [Bacteroidota bacterium]